MRFVYFACWLAFFCVIGAMGLQAQDRVSRVAIPPAGDKLLYHFGDSSAVIGTKRPDTLKGVLFGLISDTGRKTGGGTYNFGAFLLPRLDSAQISRHLSRNKINVTEGSLLYDRNNKGVRFYDGTAWQTLSVGAGSIYNTEDSIQQTTNDKRTVTMKGKTLLFTLDTVPAVGAESVKYSFFGIGTDTPRYALDVSTASFVRNKQKGTWSANTGSDSVGLRINHVVEDAKTSYGLVLNEASSKATGRSALGFHFGTGTPFMKARLWSQVGAGTNNPAFGIDVGYGTTAKELLNRIQIDSGNILLQSVSYAKGTEMGNDSAVIIGHSIKDAQTSYGLVLSEQTTQTTGKSALGFRNINTSANYMKAALWAQMGASYTNPSLGIDVADGTKVLRNRVLIDKSFITLLSNGYATSATTAGVDTAVRIQHRVNEGSTSYGLLLEEQGNKATGRSAIGFHFIGTSNPFMKGNIWTQVGAGTDNPVLGIDVADETKALRNRVLIDKSFITFLSNRYATSATTAGVDTAVRIQHQVNDNSTSYGLLLEEQGNKATGRSAIGFHFIGTSNPFIKGNIWAQVGAQFKNPALGIDVADSGKVLRSRVLIDTATILLQSVHYAKGTEVGNDSAVTIGHSIKDGQTSYGLVLSEQTVQSTGKSALGFRNTHTSANYMKAALWAQMGASYTNPSLGIDVADGGKTLRNRVLIDKSFITLLSNRYATNAATAGVDTAVRIQHNVQDAATSYGLLLEEQGNKATGKSAIGFRFAGTSPFMKGNIWTQVGDMTDNPALGIDVADGSKALRNRVLIDKSFITFLSNGYATSPTTAGVDTAVRIQHQVSENSTSYGLLLEEQGNKATGRSAIGFRFTATSNSFMKGNIWTQVGSMTNNSALGIDVADGSKTLRNRVLIDKSFITLMSNAYTTSSTTAGVDTAVLIRHNVQDNNTSYGLLLEEAGSQATGKSAIGFRNSNSSGDYVKAQIWTAVGTGYIDPSFGIDVADGSKVLQNRVYINKDGAIGIGAQNPRAAIYIASKPRFAIAYDARFASSVYPGYRSEAVEISLYAEGSLVAPGLYIRSDKRIKNIIGDLTPSSAVSDIEKIHLVRYHSLDTLRTTREYRGVIAQELEKVMPQAVGILPTYIPSVYKYADKVTTAEATTSITLSNHRLVKGDKVQIFVLMEGTNYPIETDVLSVNEAGFAIANVDSLLRLMVTYPEGKNPSVTKVFVYGKFVQDGRAVDYNQIMVTNVAATQELIRQNVQLKAQSAVLEQDNIRVHNTLQQQAARIEKLEQHLQELISAQKKGGVTQSGW